MRQLYFIANWKMHKVRSEALSYAASFIKKSRPAENVSVVLAPPYPYLSDVSSIIGDNPWIKLGAQNCHWSESGAHTGEVSPVMLKDCGAGYVILGHSERRTLYGETSERVANRAGAAIAAGLTAVVCVGEPEEVRFDGNEKTYVSEQLHHSLTGIEDASKVMIAYEPVWAIGTGQAATPEAVTEMHRFIRTVLNDQFGGEGVSIPVLYGGSVKDSNIENFLALDDVYGALVGGASLESELFFELIRKGCNAAGI
jgi:triosephosphate isomerase (TIM)